MEFNGLLIFAALWVLLNVLGKVQKKKKKPTAQRRQAPRTGPPERVRPLPHDPDAPDATQREGSRLETVLRQLERALDDSGTQEQPITLSLPRKQEERHPYRSTTLSPPREEEVEDLELLEMEPEVVSLETDVRREARRRVVQDDDAEQIEVRRISAAAARDKASTKADHAEFDKRIRQQPADKTATGYTVRQLRDAVVWREILGPPVSLRDELSEK